MQKAKLAAKHEKTVGDVVRSKYVLPLLSNEPGIVLDVGAGGVPKGDVNVDLNRGWWDWFKKPENPIPIPNFILADATALPFKEAVFSSVVGCDLLEHIADDKVALSEMRRVLKLGGKAILHTPNKDQTHIMRFTGAITVRDKTLTFGVEQKEHERSGYSPDELRMKLTETGFSEIAISETFNITECLAWEWDRFIVYECLCAKKDPATATIFPLRQNNLVYIQKQMLSFDPGNYKNLAWLVVAK